MMKALVSLTALSMMLITSIVPAFSEDVWVNGYTRSNGTYVQGHYRSHPDGNAFNNYSTRGNYNPYNGQRGTVNPYNSTNYDRNVGLPSTNLQSPSYRGYGY
jgi:hypothetical protein